MWIAIARDNYRVVCDVALTNSPHSHTKPNSPPFGGSALTSKTPHASVCEGANGVIPAIVPGLHSLIPPISLQEPPISLESRGAMKSPPAPLYRPITPTAPSNKPHPKPLIHRTTIYRFLCSMFCRKYNI